MSIKTKKRLQKVASIATSAVTVLTLSGAAMFVPAAAATYSNGTLLKTAAAGDIYVVNNNLKVPVRSADVFNNSGYSWSAVKTVSQSALDSIPNADLIKTADNPDVYKLEKNFSRKLASIEIFNSYNLDWAKISTVSQPVMNSFSYAPIFQHGADLFWRDANNVLHKFNTMTDFTGNGYNTRDLIPANDMEYGSFAIGGAISGIPSTPSQGTGLSVSLASDTPASSSIPGKASGVTYAKFNLTAGTDGAVTVTNMTVKRVGVGDPADFANVYLYDGATRLTSGRSVNSTTNEVSFASLNLTIPSGSTKTLSIVVDMKTAGADSGNVDAFQLASSSAITTTAAISGVFPLTGNIMTVATADGGTLTVAKGADPTNPNVGQTAATIGEFTLNAATEDVNVKRIALYNGGTISRSNLTNFKLYQGETLLASTSGLDSKDLATFDMTSSPYTLAKGITRSFTVKADIGGNSKPNDTVVLYVDQASDVYAVGATYGFGVQPDITGFDSGTNNSVAINGGTITITTDGPQTGNVAKGANDVDFLNFSIASAANADIRNMRIEFHTIAADLDGSEGDVSSNYITDIKVVDADTGVAVTSSVDINGFTEIAADDAGMYKTYTDTISLTAGQTRNFKITADLNASISADTFYVTLGTTDGAAFSTTDGIKNTDNNQYITDIVPSSAIAGQQQTTSAASLTPTMATTPSSQSYIKGATNVESAGFIFTAGTGADIKVTSLRLTGYVSDDADQALAAYETGALKVTDMVSSVSLWDGSTQLGTVESFNSSGVATFDGFTLLVPKGESKTLVAKANISNSVNLDPTGGDDDDLARFALDIAATTDVTAVTNDDSQTDVDFASATPNAATGTPKTVITVRQAGTLTASQDAGTPSSALVMAGSSNSVFAKVKFSSTYEELKITKLQVAVPTPATYADNITSVSVEGGGQSAVSVAMSSAGVANFSGLNIIVPKDGSAVVTISANLATITGGADSGDTVQLEVTSTNFEAVGTGTSNTKKTTATGLDAVGSSAGGNDMIVKATIPTVSTTALTSATLSNSTQTVYKFTVTNTAPSGGYDVSLKKIKFDMSVVDSVYANGDASVKLNTFKVYRTGETSAISNVTFYIGTATAAANIVGTNVSGLTSSGYVDTTTSAMMMVFDNKTTGEEVVSAGTSKTYEIRAAVSGTGVGSNSKDYVMTRIADTAVANQTPKMLAYATNGVVSLEGTAANFIWSDNAMGVTHISTPGTTASATNRDWTDAYLMQAVPTDYQTVTQ